MCVGVLGIVWCMNGVHVVCICVLRVFEGVHYEYTWYHGKVIKGKIFDVQHTFATAGLCCSIWASLPIFEMRRPKDIVGGART